MKDWTYNPIEDVYKDAISTTNFSTRISGKLRLDIMKGLNIEVGGVWQRAITNTNNCARRILTLYASPITTRHPRQIP